MRGLAALVVFLAHARNMFFGDVSAASTTGAHTSAHVNVPVGAAGIGTHAVIIFFVLSGYLVGGGVVRTMEAGRWTWSHYIRQRLTRLWVVLVPALLIGCALDNIGMRAGGPGAIYGAPPGQSVIGNPAWTGLNLPTFGGNVFFLQDILVPVFGSNVALWSLANEFWYYLAFPVAVIIYRSSTALPIRVLGLVALVGLGWLGAPMVTLYFFIWLLGVVVSRIPLFLGRASARALIALSGVGLVFTSAWVRTHRAPLFLANMGIGLVFCILLYGCLHRRDSAKKLYSNLAAGIANMSYTLYLVHVPALMLVSAVVVGGWHPWKKDAPHLIAFACVIGGVLLYAALMYLFFERHTERVRLAISGGRQAQVQATGTS
jgi:peptidoglycan/LPS O-acetylase OafA/YrhL